MSFFGSRAYRDVGRLGRLSSQPRRKPREIFHLIDSKDGEGSPWQPNLEPNPEPSREPNGESLHALAEKGLAVRPNPGEVASSPTAAGLAR
jgi:hypothetical protein